MNGPPGVSHPINRVSSVSSKQDGTLLVWLSFCQDQKLCNCSILFRDALVTSIGFKITLVPQPATIRFAIRQVKLPQHVVCGTT